MKAYALTDEGKVRTTNQDYIFSSPKTIGRLSNLYLVADGMGGHKAGDFASRFLTEKLVAYIEKTNETSIISILEHGIQEANSRLYQESLKNSSLAGMGTTLVAATIEYHTLYTANVGDSRLYLIRVNEIRQITKDHSYVEELVSLGKMERNSPDYRNNKNIITRAVGTQEQVAVDFFEITLEEGDFILLCSDGLTNMVEDSDIVKIVTSKDGLKEKTERLIALANENGGKDNIAVILVEPQISEVSKC